MKKDSHTIEKQINESIYLYTFFGSDANKMKSNVWVWFSSRF